MSSFREILDFASRAIRFALSSRVQKIDISSFFLFRRVCLITLGSGLRVHCVLSSGDIPWLALTLEWHIWKSAFFGLFSRYFRSWFIRQSIRHSVTMWIWDVRFVKSYESFCFSVRLDMVSATSTKVLSFYPYFDSTD